MAETSPAASRLEPAGPGTAGRAELLSARNGQPSLRVGAVSIHSRYDPEREAEAWARGVLRDVAAPAEVLWVVFGGGLGYHPEALRAAGARHIVVFEPDAAIARMRTERRTPDGADRTSYVCTEQELADRFIAAYPRAEGTRIVSIPGYARLYPDALERVRERLTTYVQELKTDGVTYVSYAAEWLDLTAANLPVMVEHRPFHDLAGLAAGWPVVVVSPGPSLDRNIDVLRDRQQQAIIICPSQTLRALSAAGVRPDLVVVTDSQNLDYHFAGVAPAQVRNLVLAAKCHPAVVALAAERKYFYHLPFNSLARKVFELWCGRAGDLQAGHSVANACFSLAVQLDADPVILVGQDLAFSGEKMYCSQAVDGAGKLAYGRDGSVVTMAGFTSKLKLADPAQRRALEQRLATPQRVLWVEGHNGERLPTNHGLRAMLTWFEREAERLQGSRRLVNATEGGARIAGMEHMPLAEVLDETPAAGGRSADFDARLDVLGGGPAGERMRLHAGLRRLAAGYAEIERLARGCERLAERAARAANPERRLLEKLRNREQRLGKRLAANPEVDAKVQDAMRQHRALGDPAQDDLATNLDRSRILYGAVRNASRSLKHAVHRVIQKGVRDE